MVRAPILWWCLSAEQKLIEEEMREEGMVIPRVEREDSLLPQSEYFRNKHYSTYVSNTFEICTILLIYC